MSSLPAEFSYTPKNQLVEGGKKKHFSKEGLWIFCSRITWGVCFRVRYLDLALALPSQELWGVNQESGILINFSKES